MEYKVSEKVQKKFDTLTKDAKIQKALQFMEEDQDTVIDKQIELTLIPAPTNHEQKKACLLYTSAFSLRVFRKLISDISF